MKIKSKIIVTLICCCLLTPDVFARVKGSPHDLTAIGAGDVCGFCHTPHGSDRKNPLWSHKLSDTVYKIYQSTSLDAKVGQPTGMSKLCLSCHDGTVALTHKLKGGATGGVYITPGTSNLGTDLSDDHPISFIYSDSLSAKDPQIRLSYSLPKEFRLDKFKEMQCTTCHDPHEDQYGNFLVMSNLRSAMCISCHDMKGWNLSSHQSSTAQATNAADVYLKKSEYGSVAENGCNSCHRPHSAGGNQRLLHFDKSEKNCLNCHNGSVAAANLENVFNLPSKHNVKRYDNIHDIKESIKFSEKHVECVDCHNPHAVQKSIGHDQIISNAMLRVSGVTISGSETVEAQYEYEVCFKCHGDNPDRVESKITRQITQTNTRFEFDTSNPSYHPIASPGANDNVPSLELPMTISSIIKCTSCHNSDDSTQIKGPHGSNYSPLLAFNYETSDFTSENESAYELCYQCHSRNSILNDESFPKHLEHLDDKTPCSACHDPHGISLTQGSSVNNTHLINFDTSIVSENSLGLLEFIDTGTFTGKCSLNCHGKDHIDEEYQ